MADRRYRAGDSVEDICRACKLDRMHTVIVVDGDGRPIRVSCGYCDSEHNYRGGPALRRCARDSAASERSPAEAAPSREGQTVPSEGGPAAANRRNPKTPSPSSATVNGRLLP